MDTLQSFPCREKQINKLIQLIGNGEELLPESLFVYGHTSTGKSSIVNRLLTDLSIKFVTVNLIECYNAKSIFETILNNLNPKQTDIKCDNVPDFIIKLKEFDETLIIVLDKAERLRNNEMLLSVFLRLQEFTEINISAILISDVMFEQFFPTSLKSPIQIFFPHYSKAELLEILSLDFPKEHQYIEKEYNQNFDVGLDFYQNYLNVLLSIFYRACKDLSEIKYMAHINFKKYCHPVLTNQIDSNDVAGLWRNISPILKSSLENLYHRIDVTIPKIDEKITCNIELPFYAKFLIIAAYLASYNPVKEDKRLFVKLHDRKRNTKRRIESKQLVSEKTALQLGPKLFGLDRLLAIFYAIIEEQVPLTSNLLVQLSSLVELKMLQLTGNDTELSSQKYRCNVDYEFIQSIAKMVGFNIQKYLYDLQ